jgi:hypothetical protein
MKSWFICLVVALPCVTSFGREDPAETLERDWRAEAAKAKLSPAAIKHLEQEKVLMTQDEFLQCYQAYLRGGVIQHDNEMRLPPLPYFITTDALFQAYAWCLQKGTARMETAHAGQMREYLGVLMASLNQVDSLVEGDAAQIQKAKEMAMFVVGVAAVLMDAKMEIKSETVRRDVEQEVTRVRNAQGTQWPARLKVSPKDPRSLDYSLFKPVGLYAGDKMLEQYFTAVRWLQLVPFCAASDEHMLAAAMLSHSHSRPRLLQFKLDEESSLRFEERERRLEDLAGPSQGTSALQCVLPLPQDQPAKKATEWIQEARETVKRKDALREASDSVAVTSSPRRASSDDAAAHIILASTLTDAMLLEKLSQAKGPSYFPDALSIASWLGSDYAAEWEKADPKTTEIRQDARQWLVEKRPNLYQEGLMLLQKLVEPPPADAPAYMKSRSWQAKSCQTVLAAWAQSRHVWALQAQPHYSIGAGMREWPAFVERAPDFFVSLAGLCRRAAWLLKVPESEELVNERISRKLRQMADGCASQAVSSEQHASEAWMTTLEMLLDAGVKYDEGPYNDSAAVTKFTRILRECADMISRGESTVRHPVAQRLRERLAEDRKVPFDDLEKTCLRLAVLAHKQARELYPNAEEFQWLITFGVELSSFTDCHFTSPVDNVPKAVRVFTNPELGKALTVGIGRPRFLYVLHPWKGKEVLCRGAVLPYLERHELESLTDEEWKQKLDDAKTPPIQPEWIKPLMEE